MSTQTLHYNMTKPAGTEKISRTVLNNNFDIVDTELYKNSVLTGITAPTTSTAGALNQIYIYKLADGSFKGLYICTKITGTVYTWKEVSPYKIGDVIFSRRTDLGADYTLADGGIATATLYPNLSSYLVPITINGTYQEIACPQSTLPNLVPRDIEYYNGYYVKVFSYSSGSSTVVAVSDDFINWTTYVLANGNPTGIVVKDGKFHILVNRGSDGCIIYSASVPINQASWTANVFRSASTENYMYDVKRFKVLNGKFVIIATRANYIFAQGTYYYDELYTMTNAGAAETTLQLISMGTTNYGYSYDIAFDGTGYTLYQSLGGASGSGWIKYSPDATSLVALKTLSNQYAFAIVYFGGRMNVYTGYSYSGGEQGMTVFSSPVPATAAQWTQSNLATSGAYTAHSKVHIEAGVLYLISCVNVGSIDAFKFTTYNTFTNPTLASGLKYSSAYSYIFKAFADVVVFEGPIDYTNYLEKMVVVGNFLPLATMSNAYGYIKIS